MKLLAKHQADLWEARLTQIPDNEIFFTIIHETGFNLFAILFFTMQFGWMGCWMCRVRWNASAKSWTGQMERRRGTRGRINRRKATRGRIKKRAPSSSLLEWSSEGKTKWEKNCSGQTLRAGSFRPKPFITHKLAKIDIECCPNFNRITSSCRINANCFTRVVNATGYFFILNETEFFFSF